jgi:C1A family cysteine protease
MKINPRLGCIRDKEDPRDFLLRKVIRTITLPEIMDYEAYMTPIKDQGNRGACVSFATIAVKEYQERKQRKFKKASQFLFDFSEEFLYDQIMLDGGGAMIRDALHLLEKQGVPREQYMPYDYGLTDDKVPEFNPSKQAVTNAKSYKAQSYARLMTIDDMMQSLVINGSFVIGVDWLQNWFNPTEKVDDYPILRPKQGGKVGGHALAIVGYNKARGYFKFKNSWSQDWGKGGYALFSFDAIKENLLDAWATIDMTSPYVRVAEVQKLVKEKDKEEKEEEK